ncbi:MAG: hypothetical protein U5R31_03060 [Acidimicrobiia bacterium]|nr:hypothetical protein [Acidimicrobiia bacterium]
MSLATLPNYKLRHGDVAAADEPKVTQLLEDASSLVRKVARLHISEVSDDEIEVDGDGSRRLLLPEIPVTAVSAVSVEGEALDADDYRWWAWGGLDRRDGDCWPVGPRTVTVTYTHGESPVPAWIVSIVCSMVFESLRPQVSTGEQAVTTGSQTVSYFTARSNLYVPAPDEARLVALRGPVLA